MNWLQKLSTAQSIGLIACSSLVVFASFNGQSHLFDWDEINFAEAAREMITTGNYSVVQINYEPFWEKPPLFFWMQVLAMKLFGINEFAARFPNAIAGVFTSIFLFLIGKKHFGQQFGWLWAMAHGTSLLPLLYFKSGIIDPWFNLFIFGGMYFTWRTLFEGKNLKWALFAGASIGLGIMTKGPVALLVLLMVYGVYFLWVRFKGFPKMKELGLFLLSLLSIGGLWFFIEWINGRGYIIQDFINYQIRLLETQDAGHGGPFYYHFVVLLFGCFPMSVLAFGGFKNSEKESKLVDFHRIQLLLFLCVLILFSLVNTKIIHYSSLCYFPLSYFAAVYLNKAVLKQQGFSIFQKAALGLVGTVLSLAFIALPYLGNNTEILRNADWIKDDFAKANFMAENIWSEVDYLLPVIFVGAIVGFLLLKGTRRFQVLLFGSLVSFLIIIVSFVPKIEAYTQRAAIEFYKSKQQEDCYVTPVRYKSYAHLFYSQKPPQQNKNHSNSDWLLNGETDKPVYCVLKITSAQDFKEKNTHFKLLYERNGFAFFEKTTAPTSKQ